MMIETSDKQMGSMNDPDLLLGPRLCLMRRIMNRIIMLIIGGVRLVISAFKVKDFDMINGGSDVY
ncbi:hypothetical protein Hanom_Chr15g01407501 [Helianthus anomalus]